MQPPALLDSTQLHFVQILMWERGLQLAETFQLCGGQATPVLRTLSWRECLERIQTFSQAGGFLREVRRGTLCLLSPVPCMKKVSENASKVFSVELGNNVVNYFLKEPWYLSQTWTYFVKFDKTFSLRPIWSKLMLLLLSYGMKNEPNTGSFLCEFRTQSDKAHKRSSPWVLL